MKLSKIKELLKKLDAKSKQTNKAFEKASPSQKRVMVLEDALKQLRKGKYKAESGTYFDVVSSEEVVCDESIPEVRSDWDGLVIEPSLSDERVTPNDAELKSVIDLPITTCNVCAIGGAFASVVRLKDKLKKGRVYGEDACLDWHTDPYIARVFPSKLLRLMESAFELEYFGYDHDDASVRLKAIYRNIIKNEGKAFTYHRRMTIEEYRVDRYGFGVFVDRTVTGKDPLWSERGWRAK